MSQKDSMFHAMMRRKRGFLRPDFLFQPINMSCNQESDGTRVK